MREDCVLRHFLPILLEIISLSLWDPMEFHIPAPFQEPFDSQAFAGIHMRAALIPRQSGKSVLALLVAFQV